MACGVPVITPKTQGPGETVPYPELLVAEIDDVDDGGATLRRVRPPALAAGIGRLLADPVELERTSILGRTAAVKKYDIRIVAASWEKTL
jgi:glycosyltransferase involved in cell wall biosynthesis